MPPQFDLDQLLQTPLGILLAVTPILQTFLMIAFVMRNNKTGDSKMAASVVETLQTSHTKLLELMDALTAHLRERDEAKTLHALNSAKIEQQSEIISATREEVGQLSAHVVRHTGNAAAREIEDRELKKAINETLVELVTGQKQMIGLLDKLVKNGNGHNGTPAPASVDTGTAEGKVTKPAGYSKGSPVPLVPQRPTLSTPFKPHMQPAIE